MHTRIFRPASLLALAVVLVGVLSVTPATRAQVYVQSFDATRDGHPGPIATLGMVGSPYFAAVRAAVASRYANSVVFGTPRWPAGVPAVTAEVLEDADVFVVTGSTVTLTAEEACLLQAFVEQGGAVLSMRNEWTAPTLLGTELGTFGGSGRVTVMDPTSPIVAGPFGTVPSSILTGAGTNYLPSGEGWPVLADSGRVMLVTFGEMTSHRGRAVLVGDEEIFLNGPTPFGASLRGTSAGNQLLFANIIDYLINAPGLDAEGAAALRACSDRDCDGSNGLEDCDDTSAAVFPDAEEVMDGQDNDCDGEVDEGLDQDGDGVPDRLDLCNDTPAGGGVDPAGCPVVCEIEEPEDLDEDGDGYVASADCNDLDAAVHPGAVDLPGNAADEDCDGVAVCDPDDDWRNHGQFVSCVKRALKDLVSAGALDRDRAEAWFAQINRGAGDDDDRPPSASQGQRGHDK